MTDFGGLDIAAVNDLTATAEHSSEAVEFVSPLRALRKFANADITNQELSIQSVVLVNGVEVNLNLQQVEGSNPVWPPTLARLLL
jgi:cobalamin biosynthesis Co2+ chelatase CbiK